MSTLLLTCTCPRSTNSRDELVRYTDQLCPVHGAKAQQLPHCATCTCGVGSPIVQVPKVEKP